MPAASSAAERVGRRQRDAEPLVGEQREEPDHDEPADQPELLAR